MTETDRFLVEYVEAYLAQAAAMTWDDLRARQRPPFAAVSPGAAGLAYAFARAFAATGVAGYLGQAQRWSDTAWAARDTADGCREPDTIYRAGSIGFGPPGIAYVRTYVAALTGDAAATERAIDTFVATSAEPIPDDVNDYLGGGAGRLAAAAALLPLAHGQTRTWLLALGDRIATRITAALAQTPASAGFAHGTAGVCHALVRWAEATNTAPSPTLFAALDALIDAPVLLDGSIGRGWCNGAAGPTLTFAAAHRVTGRAAYRTAARDRAAAAVSAEGTIGSLCCGLAGRGYAALAMRDLGLPGRWRDQASAIANAAIDCPSNAPNGLFTGHPGIVCLALDVVGGAPARFPIAGD